MLIFFSSLCETLILSCSAAKDFIMVQRKVAELLKGRILVGHALHNDLKVSMEFLQSFRMNI